MIFRILLLFIFLLPLPAVSSDDLPADRDRRPALINSDFSYENITITEDVTWRGTVLVRGSLVVAPQVTLRIEPGTVVRFMKSTIIRKTPRLVIMGRLQCSGTPEKPVLFAPNYAVSRKGDWGGVLFLSSEKRNQMENCRIEGAETALQSHFSTIFAKGVSITACSSGLMLRDSTANLSGISLSGSSTAMEVHDSEIDLRDSAVTGNRNGIVAYRSALAITSVKVSGCEKEGLLAEECRLRLVSCEFSGNAAGVFVKGGEGQMQMSRFVRNALSGLHLSNARIRVQRCLFADNLGDGMKVDDGRSSVWSSSFSGNRGYNLANTGLDTVTALLNWWGSNDEAAIMAKLTGRAKEDPLRGNVAVSPWLGENPAIFP